MEDDDLSPAERERMRRFDEWLRVSRGVLAKWAVPLALAFCVLAVLLGAALVRRAAASPFRYIAETRLLFSPRQAPKVPAMGDRQLLGVLDRASVKRAAGARLGLAPEAAAGLDGALSLKQEKKPTNLFTVSAAAPSPEAAVARANAYAEALVAEYAAWRTRDLASWDETLESRRAALQERIAAVEAEETAAKSATGVVSPVETLTLLNGLVSDQRRNRSRLGVELANEQARRKRLEE
ncbi:MAG: hypothetical protein II840_03215, partial [Kiritimatiellae bacterium]|nr:hypothetical protein [Kiritimatiellia bacterium]